MATIEYDREHRIIWIDGIAKVRCKNFATPSGLDQEILITTDQYTKCPHCQTELMLEQTSRIVERS